MQEVMREDEDPPFGQTLRERVLVPFPMESDLSGEIPKYPPGCRVKLEDGRIY
jgi:hypothetical protein